MAAPRRDVVAGPSASKATNLQNATFGRAWNHYEDAWSISTPANQPAVAGTYQVSIHREAGFDTLSRYILTARDWWVHDTLFKIVTTGVSWSSSTPGCPFTGGYSTSPYPVHTETGGCTATDASFHYQIVPALVETPLTAQIDGPSEVLPGVTKSWTAIAGGTAYKGVTSKADWQTSVDGGATWTYWCIGAQSCQLNTGSVNFLLRARVFGAYHQKNELGEGVFLGSSHGWAWVSKNAAQTIEVIVLPPPPPPAPPLAVSLIGPQFISPWTWTTWSTSVSGGYPPYSYQWYIDGGPLGTDPQQSSSLWEPYDERVLSVTVTDSHGQTINDAMYVIAGPYCEDPGNCQASSIGRRPSARLSPKLQPRKPAPSTVRSAKPIIQKPGGKR